MAKSETALQLIDLITQLKYFYHVYRIGIYYAPVSNRRFNKLSNYSKFVIPSIYEGIISGEKINLSGIFHH